METSGRESRGKIDSQRTRLAEAISKGRLYQTKLILSDFTNVNYLDSEKLSPLMRVFMIEDSKHRTRTAMVKLLLHHKANVNLRNSSGQHVLNWACKMNKQDLVQLLLERCLQDIDLTSQDLEGNTPLIYAVINNNVKMVKLLVDALKKFSLSVDQRNAQDKTAYLKALEMGFDECASILSKVGNASQDIKVNPFMDFLDVSRAESSRKIRVRSAPLDKMQYGSSGKQDTNQGNLLRNKKRKNKLFKPRKIHSVASRTSQDEKNTDPKNWSKRGKAKVPKVLKPGNKVKTFAGNNALDSPDHEAVENNDLDKPTRKSDLVSEKGNNLLRFLLDEPAQQSARSSVSYVSYNEVIMGRCGSISSTVEKSLDKTQTVDGYITAKQTEENKFISRKEFPNYHSYLVWKASLDHPPNTLRSFLALRAEQHSEQSSYRKGIVIPKYEPTSEGSVDDRSGGATSPISERSGKSEAGRKISAVAKTVGLSIYLTNKRKNSSRKEP